MRVLGVCSYPIEAAATRYRLAQYVRPLADRGIELEISSFLSSDLFAMQYASGSTPRKVLKLAKALLNRVAEIPKARQYDLILVQREAMIFGPAFFERLYRIVGRAPMVLDLDDATYLPYLSPTYGRLGSWLKFFGKTDKLISQAQLVICGNSYIAEYVESKGKRTAIIPTVVDTDLFCPVDHTNKIPVLGWIGTHSTFPMLESIFPTLKKLAKSHDFVLRIVGSGQESVNIGEFPVENLKWDLEREPSDFQTLDIGLYPIAETSNASVKWILGKSGFKAIQYLSVGIPFVMSPVGVCAEIGTPDKTHFLASTADDWFDALSRLLGSAELRKQMGELGRLTAIEKYNVDSQADILASVLKEAVGR